MTVLVVGATGNTGRPLVEQLLARGHRVRVIVRSSDRLPGEVVENPNTTVTEASVLDLSDAEMAEQVKGCDAVVSCLGHFMDAGGVFGQPRKLCADATRRLCGAIESNRPSGPIKFILMNTVAVRNRDLREMRSLRERVVLSLLHLLLPPHRDNVAAAGYLRTAVGRESEHVEWCSVRPDSLIDAEVSPYDIEESPITGIFSGRPSTRSNVAHFMVELIEDGGLWNEWKFRMPVIMNSVAAESRSH